MHIVFCRLEVSGSCRADYMLRVLFDVRHVFRLSSTDEEGPLIVSLLSATYSIVVSMCGPEICAAGNRDCTMTRVTARGRVNYWKLRSPPLCAP